MAHPAVQVPSTWLLHHLCTFPSFLMALRLRGGGLPSPKDSLIIFTDVSTVFQYNTKEIFEPAYLQKVQKWGYPFQQITNIIEK